MFKALIFPELSSNLQGNGITNSHWHSRHIPFKCNEWSLHGQHTSACINEQFRVSLIRKCHPQPLEAVPLNMVSDETHPETTCILRRVACGRSLNMTPPHTCHEICISVLTAYIKRPSILCLCKTGICLCARFCSPLISVFGVVK